MPTKEKMKVLTSKMGMDIHDTGITVVTHALRDAGMEAIYLGLHRRVEEIVESALQEDVAIIGLSFLGGEHLLNVTKLMKLLKEKGLDAKIKVVVGGVIPKDDIPKLEIIGVSKVFTPGTPMDEIINYLKGC